MSICIAWAERQDGIIGKAYEQAMEVVRSWLNDRDHCAPLRDLNISPWVWVDLAERITRQLLDGRGYDEALLEMAIDLDGPPGWSLADLDTELERTRGVSLPDGWQCGDPLPGGANRDAP